MKKTITVLSTALLLTAAFVVSATPGVTAQPDRVVVKPPSDTDTMGWVDAKGDPIICSDGQPLKVSEAEIMAAPNVGESVEVGPANDNVTEYQVTESMVPRCGPGGGGTDGQPIFVPEDVGADVTKAPRRYIRAQTH